MYKRIKNTQTPDKGIKACKELHTTTHTHTNTQECVLGHVIPQECRDVYIFPFVLFVLFTGSHAVWLQVCLISHLQYLPASLFVRAAFPPLPISFCGCLLVYQWLCAPKRFTYQRDFTFDTANRKLSLHLTVRLICWG